MNKVVPKNQDAPHTFVFYGLDIVVEGDVTTPAPAETTTEAPATTTLAETTEALGQMQASVEEITDMIIETGDMATQQATSMEEINDGIDQISTVVQSNSETAQESSNVSVTLTEQSEDLNRLIDQFKLK